MWTVSESDLGTPESEWLASDQLRNLHPVSWRHPDRVVVVAPHPDDEVLGVGGGVRWLAGRGAEVTVVVVTDGERSHPESPSMSTDELGATRRRESGEGLRRLGLVDPIVVPLGIPDGSVAAHEVTLSERLGLLLDESTLCLATWRHDGHPDHEAAGRAAANAAVLSGCRLLEYPVWAWHWAHPDDTATEGLPWAVARTFGLDRRSVRAKHHAIEAFTSQIRPIGPAPEDRAVLPGPILDRFRRPFEVLFEHADTVER